MKRREFVEKLGIGSVSLAAAAAIGRGTPVSASEQHAYDSFQIAGPMASATVSFGQCLTTPPLDRFTGVSNTRTSNQHKVIPYDVTIKAGGSVNYIISGTHLILVYAPGSDQGQTTLSAPGGLTPV